MPWFDFSLAVFICLAVLYIPGFAVLRAMRMDAAYSVALAPALSCCFVALTCIIFPLLGIFTSWTTVCADLLVPFSVAVLSMFVTSGRGKTFVRGEYRSFSLFGLSTMKSYAVVFLSALLVGVGSGVVFFLSSMESPDSFFQAFDNGHHINGIAAFVDSGNWSSFSGGFYPSCWQECAAFVSSLTGFSAPMAANAVSFSFAFIVFPLAMAVLMCALFPDSPYAAFAGSALSAAFVAFPWDLLVFGPIYPNLAALSVVPSVIAFFIRILGGMVENGHGVSYLGDIAVFIGACIGLFFLQPNVIFFAVVFLAPYCAVCCSRLVVKLPMFEKRETFGRVLGFVACFVAIVIIWLLLSSTSFIQGFFGEPGYKLFGIIEAVKHAFALSFTGNSPQYLLAVLCAMGVLYSMFNRRYLWISCSCLLSMVLFVISVTDFNEVIRNYATGVWYHDAYRLAANAVLTCIPLAGLGIAACVRIVDRAMIRFECKSPRFLVVAVVALVLVTVYSSISFKSDAQSPFSVVRSDVSKVYSLADDTSCILTKDELEFCEEVKSIVGDDVVINVPDDGSVFLYGVEDINVFYQVTRIWDPSSEDWKSAAFRLRLDDLASDREVQEAVSEASASYVLLLDKGATADDQTQAWFFTWRWYADWWEGITSIDENTPGFELVLSEGDMRLYKIDDRF